MKAFRLLGGALLLTLLAAGCGGPAGERLEPDSTGDYVIAMTGGLVFDPVEAIVPVNATVAWVNTATVPHDVAGYKGDPIKDDRTIFTSSAPPPGGFGRTMAAGERFEHTFPEKGTWTIWCHTHHEQDMKMVLHVV